MILNQNAAISEEMHEASEFIIKFAHVFGLFPVAVHRQGKKYFLKWSPFWSIYGYLFGIITIVMTYKGYYDDVTLPREKSIRIRITTDVYVTFFDISAVVVIVFCGIFITPFKYTTFYDFVKCLNEIDSIIPPTDIKSTKRLSTFLISSVLTFQFVIVVVDTLMYFRTSGERCGKNFIVQTYTPFYVSYHILLVHDCLMWHLVYCIYRRIRTLNGHLLIENFKIAKHNIFNISKTSLEFPHKQDPVFHVSEVINKNQLLKVVHNNRSQRTIVYKLMVAYSKICDSVEILNNLLGTARTITVIALLWSLIILPYIVIAEVTGDRRDAQYIAQYTLWSCIHFGRLILLAQPCYNCLMQGQKTENLVSTLLFSAEVDDNFKAELYDFSTLLLHRKFEFGANGLTNIDRTLVTTMIGSVTTYLVILLQFARVDQRNSSGSNP